MRPSVLPALFVLAASVTGCTGGLPTDPAAQAAHSRAAVQTPPIPDNVVVLVDGQRVPLFFQGDPTSAVRIEVLRGEAAVRLYGDEARNGAIRIYTAHGSSHAPPSI